MKVKQFRSEQGELCILRLWYSIKQFPKGKVYRLKCIYFEKIGKVEWKEA